MVILTEMITAQEGKGDELEQAFKNLLPQVRHDPGTVAYIAHRSIENPLKFFVYEKYEDQEALKRHTQTTHFKEFNSAIASLVNAGRPGIASYREII